MKTKKLISILIPALIVAVAFVVMLVVRSDGNSRRKENKTIKNEPYYRSYPTMGTWIEITLYGNKNETDNAFMAVYNSINSLNNICNRFDKESELSRLNNSAAKKPFKCSDTLWDILIKAKLFYEISGGTFDVTIAPLMELWGFFRRQDKIPTEGHIKEVLKDIGLDKVVFDQKNRTVFFKNPNIKIDLGGIAKGYAVDVAYDAASHAGMKVGVINLGGNMRCFPEPPPGKDSYIVAIRDPFDKEKLMEGTLKIDEKSLATSGNYERYVVIEGERYTHIINPKTGYPVKDMAATTVVCKSALWADALSTTVFLNGNKFAEEYHKKHPDIEILVIKGYRNKPEEIEVYKYGEIWKQIKIPGY